MQLLGCLCRDLLLGDESVTFLRVIPDVFAIGSCQGLPTGSSQKACSHPETEKSLSHVASAGHVVSLPVVDHRDGNNGSFCQRASPLMEKATPDLDRLCQLWKDMQHSNQEHYKQKSHPYLKIAAYLYLLFF